MIRALALVVLAIALVTGGCGGGDDSVATDTDTVKPPGVATQIRVYWLRDEKVWPMLRVISESEAIATFALEELLAGPTAEEQDDLQFTTAIAEGTEVEDLQIEDGAARVKLSAELPDEPLAQLVYTLTQFPAVETVEIQERRLTRADFEDLTPAILVESPLPFEEVASPLRVTGTANTFEANFQYELTDTDGRIIAEDFVTATSGTGTRGTFEFAAPFTVSFDGVGELIVFEPSAKDGSRTNLVEIPIRMKQ